MTKTVVATSLVLVTLFPLAAAESQRGARGMTDIPVLPYKLVEWPTPATSVAGFPTRWNLYHGSGMAVTQSGNVLVLHRGSDPLLEFEKSGKFVRSWGDLGLSEGKVAEIPPE